MDSTVIFKHFNKKSFWGTTTDLTRTFVVRSTWIRTRYRLISVRRKRILSIRDRFNEKQRKLSDPSHPFRRLRSQDPHTHLPSQSHESYQVLPNKEPTRHVDPVRNIVLPVPTHAKEVRLFFYI